MTGRPTAHPTLRLRPGHSHADRRDGRGPDRDVAALLHGLWASNRSSHPSRCRSAAPMGGRSRDWSSPAAAAASKPSWPDRPASRKGGPALRQLQPWMLTPGESDRIAETGVAIGKRLASRCPCVRSSMCPSTSTGRNTGETDRGEGAADQRCFRSVSEKFPCLGRDRAPICVTDDLVVGQGTPWRHRV